MPTTSATPPQFGSSRRDSRDDRFDVLVYQYDLADHPEEREGQLRRFALVEENRRSTPAYWVTTWETVAAAVTYHQDQEYAADWMIDTIVDLDTGDEVPAADWVRA